MSRASSNGILAALHVTTFRRVWLASLLSNMGLFVQSVGAAWTMTQLTASADMVALVQTALMLPIMLVSIPAGAAADLYDRRRVGLIALCVSLSAACILTVVAGSGSVTPARLLACCLLLGSGMALFTPAWQASVADQVPAHDLPSAVALNSVSYNVARSVGPAVGGLVVATAGAMAAFFLNALLFLPLLVVMVMWRKGPEPSKLQPERLAAAIASGLSYVYMSAAIRTVIVRAFLTGVAGASLAALLPLISQQFLRGGADLYGVLLGTMGAGAIIGALNVAALRRRLSHETLVRSCSIIMGLAILVVAISRSWPVTAIAVFLSGTAYLVMITLFNIGVQLVVPRWVAGRVIACYQAAIAGGLATGSWIWGRVAEYQSLEFALLASSSLLVLFAGAGRWFPMPEAGVPTRPAAKFREP